MDKIPTTDLMQPRYKIIAEYPSMGYDLGYIFCLDGKELFNSTEWFDKYPHLFKKLEWWEEREVGDMPEYLNDLSRENIIWKVVDFFYGRNDNMWFNLECGETYQVNENVMSFFEPATLEEYNKYQKQTHG